MRLLGPDIRLGTRTQDQYRAKHEEAASSFGRATQARRETLVAYVNGGFLVADCPNCTSGISLHPEWDEARCFGMGCWAVYRSISWPPDIGGIEAVLLARPLQHQNWLATETVADLVAENEANGLPAREPTMADRRAARVRPMQSVAAPAADDEERKEKP